MNQDDCVCVSHYIDHEAVMHYGMEDAEPLLVHVATSRVGCTYSHGGPIHIVGRMMTGQLGAKPGVRGSRRT